MHLSNFVTALFVFVCVITILLISMSYECNTRLSVLFAPCYEAMALE